MGENLKHMVGRTLTLPTWSEKIHRVFHTQHFLMPLIGSLICVLAVETGPLHNPSD